MTDGPYRAEFGAIHHEGQAGFLFTISGPPGNAKNVAEALNVMVARNAASGIRAVLNELALRATDATRAMTARIVAERVRQQAEEGRTPEWDDRYTTGGLARAAACYALSAGGQENRVEDFWPWDWSWWKPADPMRDLERAGALILAEMERRARL